MIHNVVDFRSVKSKRRNGPYHGGRKRFASKQRLSNSLKSFVAQVLTVIRWSTRREKIIGVVTVFDLIVDRPAVSTVREFLRRILTVRSDDQAALVLRRLRASPINLAAVVDESGNTAGIVSVEDLVNPLVKSTPARFSRGSEKCQLTRLRSQIEEERIHSVLLGFKSHFFPSRFLSGSSAWEISPRALAHKFPG